MTHGRLRAGTPQELIYLDYNANAPLRPEALEAMLPHMRAVGNASSVHAFGRMADEAVQVGRSQLAALIDCSPNELIVTSGATEANNLALHLAAPRGHIVTTSVEHPAVLETASAMANDGLTRHIVIGVDRSGSLDLDVLGDALKGGGVGLVSVMAANNETGVLTDLSQVVAIAHEAGALVHTDATQAIGRIPMSVRSLEVDMLSLSAHKFGGPQGVGALFLRRTAPIAHRPMLHGGSHERGWRAGTVNVAGVVGMGAAASTCLSRMKAEAEHSRQLRDRLESALLAMVGDAWVNGADADRLPGTSSITFRGAPADAVMTAMPGINVSNGSACASGAPSPSHVLLAMGLTRDDADSTLRFSLGYDTCGEDVDRAIRDTCDAVRAVRALLVADPTDRLHPDDADFVENAATLREGI